MQIDPYLNFAGQCEEAFRFYAKTLGGEISALQTFEGSPMADQMPADQRKLVLHARLTLGDRAIMGSDAPPGRYEKPQGLWVSINVDTPAEAERIFKSLSEGGKVVMPIQKTFWAIRFGMTVDRFAIPWMVNCQEG